MANVSRERTTMNPMLANVGVPMIFPQALEMACALIPIIILEALLLRRWLRLSKRDAFRGATLANLVSTIFGVPIAWLVMFLIELGVMYPATAAVKHWHWRLDSPVWQVLGFLLGAAWIPPVEPHTYWMIPAASALLLVPSFFFSVIFERPVYAASWTGLERTAISRGVLRANLASYGLLFILACVWLIVEVALNR